LLEDRVPELGAFSGNKRALRLPKTSRDLSSEWIRRTAKQDENRPYISENSSSAKSGHTMKQNSLVSLDRLPEGVLPLILEDFLAELLVSRQNEGVVEVFEDWLFSGSHL
jgi:hypothetical protein